MTQVWLYSKAERGYQRVSLLCARVTIFFNYLGKNKTLDSNMESFQRSLQQGYLRTNHSLLIQCFFQFVERGIHHFCQLVFWTSQQMKIIFKPSLRKLVWKLCNFEKPTPRYLKTFLICLDIHNIYRQDQNVQWSIFPNTSCHGYVFICSSFFLSSSSTSRYLSGPLFLWVPFLMLLSCCAGSHGELY